MIDKNTLRPAAGAGRRLFVETYGCQMNVGDTEIVVSIMQGEGYVYTEHIDEADVVLINTCSIRDNAAPSSVAAYRYHRLHGRAPEGASCRG